MTWVAWRTQRIQLVAVLGIAVLFGVWMTATGLGMGHSATWKYWTDADVYVLYALPAILGLGVGAPLVAGELDRGTQRLAWTQGMSRNQWLGGKLAVGGAVVVAASGVLAVLTQWWAGAVSIAASTDAGGLIGVKIAPAAFDATGIVIMGYAVFAFALGTTLGALIRRPGWAFAAGVPIFVAARLLIELDLRLHLIAPAIYTNLTGQVTAAVQNAWIVAAGFVPVNRTSPLPGHSWATYPAKLNACIGASKSGGTSIAQCAVINHLHYVFQYQPESHYWPLQGAETGIFVALAALILGLTVIAVRRFAA
jgi:ABC-type transport system involved in multi-copper enzyme maturation permease subunit